MMIDCKRYISIVAISCVVVCSVFAGEEKIGDVFKGKTHLENPFSLRDPFKSPLTQDTAKKTQEVISGVMKDGVFTNVKSLSEDISVYDLKVVGVLIGKERRAIVKIGDGDSFVIKEGMKIGKDRVELKAILPGGLIFVEKIINVYGQAEYLETVIPVSSATGA